MTSSQRPAHNRSHNGSYGAVDGFTQISLGGQPAADAQQAAYFRTSLVEERRQLATYLTKQLDEITRQTNCGQYSAIGRLKSHARSVEAEIRYVDGSLDRLDRRFDPADRPPN